MGRKKPPPLSAKQQTQAERIRVIREGDRPKMIADPDGYGDTYIEQEPHIQCPHCTAAHHDMFTANLHHNMQHPLQDMPDDLWEWNQRGN